jgi:hypothetical protein
VEELLVIFACLNSTGCTETSGHYYNTHPQVQEIVKKSEKMVKHYVGPRVIESVGPVLMVAAGGSGTIRLNRNFSLQGNKNNVTLGFTWEF